MSIFTTVESPPAGTGVKPGENPEIDAAVASGDFGMGGAIVNANGNYEVNGVELTYTGEDTQVVDLSNATAEDLAAIKELAEAKFLAQTTGVNTNVMNAAYEKIGLDPSDTSVSALADKVLDAAGYTPGVTDTFFDGVGGYDGSDLGIKILIDRYAEKPTDQDLIDAGLDPEEYSVVRSNAAEAFYVESKLNEMGAAAGNTKAILGSGAGFLGNYLLNSLGNQRTQSLHQSCLRLLRLHRRSYELSLSRHSKHLIHQYQRTSGDSLQLHLRG